MQPAGLFDLPEPVTAAPTPSDGGALGLAKKVTSSRTYQRQKSIAGRLTITDDQIRALLAALLAAAGRRLPAEEAARALGYPTARLPGAISTVRRMLDVEGYTVLWYEAESGHVVLDEAMLREQFGLKGSTS